MILQEYLVKLGWSVDEPSMKRFIGAVANTGAKTAELGAVAVETAGAIEAMVTKVARKYETLYYASQRTRQSVQYLQSTQFAFRNIGLSADEASASIEGMAAKLRTQPWLRALFGNANTPQEVASRLGKSGLPYFLQTRFAEMIGMDEKTLFHLQRFAQVEAAAGATFAARQKAAGIDPERLAEKTAAFGRSVNNLEGSLEILGDRLAINFLDPVSRGIGLMDKAVQWFSRIDNVTRGWAGTLATLAGTAGGLLVLEKILRRLLGLGGATATGRALGLGGRLVGGGLTGGAIAGSAAVLGMIKQNDPETKAQLQKTLGPLFYELGLSKSPDLTGRTPAGSPGGAGGERTQQVVDALVKAGYPLASAQGIAAGLFSESKLDPKSVNPSSGMSGIGQWDTRRRGMFKQQYNKDIGEGTFEEQLQFLMWELDNTEKGAGSKLRKGGMSARDSAGTFIHLFERPGAAGELSDMSRAGPMADSLSGGNITIKSTTTVNVPPGADMKSAAKEFGAAQDQANENAVRNLQTRLR